MAFDLFSRPGSDRRQEQHSFWPSNSPQYGFSPAHISPAQPGPQSLVDDPFDVSIPGPWAARSTQPSGFQQLPERLPEQLPSAAPQDYLNLSPMSSMLSPHSAQSFLHLPADPPEMDFGLHLPRTSPHGQFVDARLGPVHSRAALPAATYPGEQLLSRSAPLLPTIGGQRPAQHSTAPVPAMRALPGYGKQHAPGAWLESGCSPDLSLVSQDLSDDTDWALESPGQSLHAPMLARASSAEDLFPDPDIFAMDQALMLLDDEPPTKPETGWWSQSMATPHLGQAASLSTSRPRPSSDAAASMPSILEEDLMLPEVPLVPDIHPSRPSRGLHPISAARAVPAQPERHPSMCISQPPNSYSSSLDSEGASPRANEGRPVSTRQNAPRRAKAQRMITELSDLDLSDIEESEEEGPASVGKPRRKARPRSTPRPSPGGRRKNGAHKQHNPWSAAETRSLVEGVEMCGGGKWSEIKRLSLPNLAKRSTVDLKDKWRNLVRAAQLPNDQLMNRFLRKKGVPIDLIERVKTAMDAAQPPSPVALTKPTRTRLASGRVTSQLGRSI